MDFEEKTRQQNSNNPKKGKDFELRCQKILSKHFDRKFDHQVKIEIGFPPKAHNFDLVSVDRKIVCECKHIRWRDNGKVPSGKIENLDQAVWYFSFLNECEKIVLVRKSPHPKRGETLAEYYIRRHGHLLRDVKIWEVDDNEDTITKLI